MLTGLSDKLLSIEYIEIKSFGSLWVSLISRGGYLEIKDHIIILDLKEDSADTSSFILLLIWYKFIPAGMLKHAKLIRKGRKKKERLQNVVDEMTLSAEEYKHLHSFIIQNLPSISTTNTLGSSSSQVFPRTTCSACRRNTDDNGSIRNKAPK